MIRSVEHELNKLLDGGKAILTATERGTRRYGDYIEFRDDARDLVFRGRPLLASGLVVARLVTDNIICTVGKRQVGDMLIDESDYDTGLTYCALGDDDTTPLVTDTTLGNEGGTPEAMRNAITSKTRSGNVITLSTFFTAAQSTLAIEEAGIFGHLTASGTIDSGIMFAHWLTSFDNSGAGYDLTFDYVLTIG